MSEIAGLIEKLHRDRDLSDEEFAVLIAGETAGDDGMEGTADTDIPLSAADRRLFAAADTVRREYYGQDVYIRGLIEFTNYCRNNCYYCGIRRDNANVDRYRLSQEEILDCCREGYGLGFRTFVLQGGEDMYYSDAVICNLVQEIKGRYPDCRLTLSIGEKERKSYQAYFDAGADRYLLRHETATDSHYKRLHPDTMSLDNRKRCLYDLKEIGYQVGAGFMVGSPYQTISYLIWDLRFLQAVSPDMIGIGPFISHRDTPFAGADNGSLLLTLRMLAILRLMFPYVLLPATTALGTIHPEGRALGLQAGANVVMPNLSPIEVRGKYELYENKLCTGEEAAQCIDGLKQQVERAGYRIVVSRGDVAVKS